MPKKGQTKPWRMHYEWSNGAKGVIACFTEDEALSKADVTQRYAAIRSDGATVITTITKREVR